MVNKKDRHILRAGLLVLLPLTVLVGCPASLIPGGGDTAQTGVVSLQVVIPDYARQDAARSVGARVIDSATESARLYLDGVLFHEADLSQGTVATTAQGIVWTISIEVPVPLDGDYGSFRVDLCDAQGNVLTRGELHDVTVVGGVTQTLSVGCLPVTATAFGFPPGGGDLSYSVTLSEGQTQYYSFATRPSISYQLTVQGSPGFDARVVVFDQTGKRVSQDPPTASYLAVSSTTGTRYVGLVALDAGTYTFQAREFNQAPLVNAGPDVAPVPDTLVTFTAQATDPEGGVLTYSWDFGDLTATQNGRIVSHAFAAGGPYTVTVTATDNGSPPSSASDTLTVHVGAANLAPVVDAGPDRTARVGDILSFDATGAFDPNGDALTVTWDFGDTGTADGLTPTHTYLTAGTYTVTVTAADAELQSSDTAEIQVVANKPPVANAVASTRGVPGVAMSFDGSQSQDPDDTVLTYLWSFGDGGTAESAQVSHTYTAVGTFTASLTVTDPKGASNTDTIQITIEEAFVFGIAWNETEVFVSTDEPLVMVLIKWEGAQILATRPITARSADNRYTILPSDMSAAYDPDAHYILLLIHEPDGVHWYDNAAEIVAQTKFLGVHDGTESGGMLYDITPDTFHLLDARVVPGVLYQMTFVERYGTVTIFAQ